MGASVRDSLGWVKTAIAEYRDGRPLALLFDYDGTLSPIAHHPSLARLPVRTRQILAALRDLPGTGVGVISGRSLPEVRELIGLPGLFYAGSGGLELDLRGEQLEYPEAGTFRASLATLLGPLVEMVASYPGAWIERKPVALSLHYRGLAPLRSLSLQQEVFTLLERHSDQIRYRIVSQAIEVSPVAGWDKGTAVVAILARLGEGILPIYAGDAANDAEAMAVVCCLGGIAIGVGPEAPSLATHQVKTPRDLERGLDRLLAALTSEIVGAAVRSQESGQQPIESTSSEAHDSSLPGILVVDGDLGVRRELAARLREEGWQVWDAGTVDEAVGMLRRLPGQLDAALVDLQLPGLQGWRLLRELESTCPTVVCCATSAGVSPQVADIFRQTSDTPLFLKPVPIKEVSDELLRLLGSERKHRVQIQMKG